MSTELEGKNSEVENEITDEYSYQPRNRARKAKEPKNEKNGNYYCNNYINDNVFWNI